MLPREINDLVKACLPQAADPGLPSGAAPRKPFYKPATIYTPNDVLINCSRSPARSRPDKPCLLIKHFEPGPAGREPAVWNVLAAQPEPRSGGIPVHSHSVGLYVSAGILPELNSVSLGFRFQGWEETLISF